MVNLDGQHRCCDGRVPRENLLWQEGRGFEMAQSRLGPGRLHHCMRLIGMADRAMGLMVDRVKSRSAFGGALADNPAVQAVIATITNEAARRAASQSSLAKLTSDP